ncbi:FAD/FMN-containing dehydrogenase [Paracoccus halophilus]|uniref:FAD-linked oxidase n=1 Tax=Paracoccus halophilus TaxID=376733 RepID=A0A099F2A6_9RHOB|nr:FAD-binding oxidoreductase [Paracoccus halophilus]KGJ04381.1 FAD-linked oxidase [Paracoccus halophilus]SFA54978.1 FAD/FMN-containing dehydrogenase [Paracoccus halophilus]
MNIDAAKAALAHLDIDDNPAAVRAKSRDFFWYSPVLKDRLDHVCADFVVMPKNQDEVIEILRACHAHDVPVTVRGSGTGNYAQAMPLAGGCVIHMQNMAEVLRIAPGRVTTQPGLVIRELNRITRADSGQELRMMPSTAGTATIGGFICGGSGGVGSVRWGFLRDYGNILRIRVVTMEAEPRILDFTGEDLARVSHAYGTNGVVTEIEMPLAPAYDWIHIFVTLPDFARASRLAHALALQDGILLKLATVCEAPTAARYFQRFKGQVTDRDNVIALMVAPHSMDGFLSFLSHEPDAKLIYRSDAHDWARDPGPAYEYGWNHTTLRALKVQPEITYLQVRYAGPDFLDKVDQIRARFCDELIQHLEFLRENGVMTAAGLTLVRFSTEERLDEIIRIHEDMGCMIFNPHRYTLEEGGRQTVDERQLEFKRQADPKGLLNPGKMIAWDAPDWDYRRMYDYPGMRR